MQYLSKMKNLSNSEMYFLIEHEIGLGLVLDAKGLTKDEYRRIMKKKMKLITYNAKFHLEHFN